MREMAAAQNTAKQIKLITKANVEHSSVSPRRCCDRWTRFDRSPIATPAASSRRAAAPTTCCAAPRRSLALVERPAHGVRTGPPRR